MIEINLVPQESRKKKKRAGLLPEQDIVLSREAIVGLVIGLCVLFLVIDVLLFMTLGLKVMQKKRYEQQWEQISQNKTNTDRIVHDLHMDKGKIKAMEEISKRNPVLWSQMLNEVGDKLPRGVWLNRLSIEKNVLVLQGSAVSKEQSEMSHVHKLTANLKDSAFFVKNFADVELGFIKSRKLSNTSIADFTITAKIKGR